MERVMGGDQIQYIDLLESRLNQLSCKTTFMKMLGKCVHKLKT